MDFETYHTPKFRHPPVEGLAEELDDIGLLRELLGLEMYADQDDLDKYLEVYRREV